MKTKPHKYVKSNDSFICYYSFVNCLITCLIRLLVFLNVYRFYILIY